MVPAERSAVLARIADLIEAEIDALAEIESLDQGKPLGLARWAELPAAAAQFRYFAGLVHSIEGAVVAPPVTYQPEGRDVQAWTLREPVGVARKRVVEGKCVSVRVDSGGRLIKKKKK